MKNRMFILIPLLILMATGLTQAKPSKHAQHMDEKAMMEMYQKLATPGDPHKLFASLEGSWTTKTKEWMEPDKPPMESEGTVEIKMLLDGRYLQQEFQGTMMGQPFNGISLNAYDNMTKHYVTTWISTTGTGIFMMEGTASADGKTITLTGKHPEIGGGFMTHRAVWKIIDSNNQTFEMYGSHHSGKEMKHMEIVYTRKK